MRIKTKFIQEFQPEFFFRSLETGGGFSVWLWSVYSSTSKRESHVCLWFRIKFISNLNVNDFFFISFSFQSLSWNAIFVKGSCVIWVKFIWSPLKNVYKLQELTRYARFIKNFKIRLAIWPRLKAITLNRHQLTFTHQFICILRRWNNFDIPTFFIFLPLLHHCVHSSFFNIFFYRLFQRKKKVKLGWFLSCQKIWSQRIKISMLWINKVILAAHCVEFGKQKERNRKENAKSQSLLSNLFS